MFKLPDWFNDLKPHQKKRAKPLLKLQHSWRLKLAEVSAKVEKERKIAATNRARAKAAKDEGEK